MTSEEFNDKYKQYIPEGWYGLGFNISDVTDYLDKVMEELILIPGFELHQIKLKFNMARFYFETNWKNKGLEAELQYKIENQINTLVKEHDEKNINNKIN
jgi:hypothetical protein